MVYYIVGVKTKKDLRGESREKYHESIKMILGYLGVTQRDNDSFCEGYRERLKVDICFHVEDIKLPVFLRILTKPSRRDSLDKVVIKTIG